MEQVTTIWQDVTAFHQAFNHPVKEYPLNLGTLDLSTIIDLKNVQSNLKAFDHKLTNRINFTTSEVTKLRLLRMRLLVEEFTEYLLAEEENDLIEVADALGDMHYIAAGTEIAYGIPAAKVFSEIQRSNMSKLDAEGNPIYDSTGKVIKPKGWMSPNIADIINQVSSDGI